MPSPCSRRPAIDPPRSHPADSAPDHRESAGAPAWWTPTFAPTGPARWGPVGASTVLRPWTERLVDLLRPRPGERVLDCPSDTGGLTRRLLRAVGPEGTVIAADADPRIAAVTAAGLGVRGLAADPGRLPLADGSVDAAASVFTLHLAPDPAGHLVEMLRVVDPRQGRVAVLVPLGGDGSPHETAVAALTGDPTRSPALLWEGVPGLLEVTAQRLGTRTPQLSVDRWRDVVRFDGVDHVWTALVTERGVDAELTPERRTVLEGALLRWIAADGTLRIASEAVLLSAWRVPS